jgi:5-methylcytosine-specific restriction endonuclease McrA
MDTLVLSHTYQPLKLVNWFDAFNMVLSGRAELVASYDDKEIRSFTQSYKMPSVIRFFSGVINKFTSMGYVKVSRKNVWARDNGTCQYCGKTISIKDSSLDHVIPRSRGGKKIWKNIVLSCVPCNQKKDDKTPQEANMRLRSIPVKPKNIEIAHILAKNKESISTWGTFLNHYLK